MITLALLPMFAAAASSTQFQTSPRSFWMVRGSSDLLHRPQRDGVFVFDEDAVARGDRVGVGLIV